MIGVVLAKKAIADSVEALNQRNLPKFMSIYSDDATFIFPGEVPASGTFKGKHAIESWWRSFFLNYSRDFNSIFKTFVSRTSLTSPEPM